MNITKLTSQAGSYTSVIHGNTCFTYEQLQKFVDIVRAETLEEAAMLAYDLRFRSCWTAEAIAAAIRKLK